MNKWKRKSLSFSAQEELKLLQLVGEILLTFDFTSVSHIITPVATKAKSLNKHITSAMESLYRGLKFGSIDSNSLRIEVFSNESSASNSNLTSQLGYVIALADKHGNANVFHYTSTKLKLFAKACLRPNYLQP